MLRVFKIFRRRPSRHTVRQPCQVVRERDFRLIADRIENLSVWGMQVGPADPTLTGETLIVSFRIPGSDVWIDTEALVTRVIHGRRPGEHKRAVALEFQDLRPWHRYLLGQALRKVPTVPVGPRPGRRATLDPMAAARLLPAC